MSGRVGVTVDGPVRTVVLDRPDKRNALDAAMLAGLETAFDGEPDVTERVVVVRAEGPTFCAGVDLHERSSGTASGIERSLHAVERWPLPVVAVVAGDAIAGGAELAFHCDLVVAAEDARIGMSIAQIGLAPPWPLVAKLHDVAGPAMARELLLLGDPVPAARLAALGAVAAAVPAAEVDAEAQRVVERLAANAPLSLRALKAALVRAAETRADVAHDDVDRLIDATHRSDDAREGIRARFERRPARFTGT